MPRPALADAEFLFDFVREFAARLCTNTVDDVSSDGGKRAEAEQEGREARQRYASRKEFERKRKCAYAR